MTNLLATSLTVKVQNTTPLVPVYGILPNKTSVMEGSEIAVSVTASNVGDGTILYWTIEPEGTLTSSDFLGNTLSGSVTITNGQASFVLSLVEDGVDTGEGFTIKLRTDSISGTIVATTLLIDVVDSEPIAPEPTYTLSANKTQVVEGESVILTLSTINVPDGTFYWHIKTGSQTVADDLGTVGGTVSIGNGVGTFSIGALTDALAEGTEEFIVGVKDSEGATNYLVSSPTIKVLDVASSVPTYIVSPVATSITSGDSLLINVNTTNVSDGTVFYYAIKDVPTTNSGGGSDGSMEGWSVHNIPGAPPLTAETIALYNRLVALRGTKTLFFQHRAHESGCVNLDGTMLGLGQNWKSANSETTPIDTDCKRLYGKNPGLAATDLNGVINLTGTQYNNAKLGQYRINRRLLKAGMYLCPTLHAARHPYTNSYQSVSGMLKTSKPLPSPFIESNMYVEEMLPGGKYNTNLVALLDLAAEYFDSYDDEGKKIPMIPRFLHESNGTHFWWGFGPDNKYCPPSIYAELFRYMFTYLRVEKGVDNILIQWNVNWKGMTYAAGASAAEYAMTGYPGADYVDMITSDCYNSNPAITLGWHYTLAKIASEQKKLTGLAETCCGIGGFYRPDRPNEIADKATWHQWWANALETEYIRDNVFFGFWSNSHRGDAYLTWDEPYFTNFKTYFYDNPRFLFQGDAW